MKYSVIDYTYNGEIVFTGTYQECLEFLEKQGTDIGYDIVDG